MKPKRGGRRRGKGVLIRSDARQGISALVPNRSLTYTLIICSPPPTAAGAGVEAVAFLSFFSFGRFSAEPSTPLISLPDSLAGDLGRARSWSLYPRSSLRCSSLS